ncbi:MAG: hypothetical protein ABII12_12570 [Planctomycetota bacterium]
MRKRKNGPLSGTLGIVLVIVFLCTAGYLTYRTLTTAPPPEPGKNEVTLMCAETGKLFPHDLKTGETWPVMSPHSTKKTGFPAEKCYWTKDGKRKETPTYVILNHYLNKPGDTICPDCGRIVIPHNPPPPPDTPRAAAASSQPTTQPK